ncbi:hypothetical protein ARSEF4850_008061 [Beauveria asiatica]
MMHEIATQDAAFFAVPDPAHVLAVEIRKTRARLKALEGMHAAAMVLQKALVEPSARTMEFRAAALGKLVNKSADPAFVQELERLDFDQLCFLAKGYDVPGIGQRLQADCLQIFMLTHKAIVDEDARKFVTAGVKRAGGRFLEIFENARQKQSGDIAAAQHTPALCRSAYLAKATAEARPMTAMTLLPKTFVATLLHEEMIATMVKDKSWIWADYCSDVRQFVYANAFEWRVEVPRGVDPRTIKVLAEQGKGGVVHIDTIDVVVVKTEHYPEAETYPEYNVY